MSNEVRKLPKIQKVDDTNNGSDKKKKCPYCGFYMSSTEKVCSTCGQKYHSPVYPVVVLIVLVLSIFSISSCMKSCTSSSDTTDANPKIMELLQSTYYVTGVISDVKISYDNSNGTDMYSVYITAEGLSLGLQEVRNGYQPKSNWTTIVDNSKNLADDTYQQIKKFDSTANLTVSIVNDLNPDNALIIVIDGVLFYDALNDE